MGNDARADYDQIRSTWRFQEEVVKQSMVRELREALSVDHLEKTLTADIVKLIDEIETEIRLEELDPDA